MNTSLIGIDAATEDARIGLAFGQLSHAGVRLDSARVCSREQPAVDTLVQWLSGPVGPTLLAIDAPLGWPSDLSGALINHAAGSAIPIQPNLMFRRATDRFVHDKLGRTPLDVGADRIARTAHFALALLGHLRRRLDQEIPLAWLPDFSHLAAIEVYPAATLIAHGINPNGYKKPTDTVEREGIIESLRAHIALPDECSIIHDNPDALDAVICVLAGADFLRQRVHDPEDPVLARKEGWIWFPRRQT